MQIYHEFQHSQQLIFVFVFWLHCEHQNCLGGGSPRYCCSYSCLCYYPVQVCRTVVTSEYLVAAVSQRTAEYFAQFSQIYSMQIQFCNSNCESNLTLTIFCRFPCIYSVLLYKKKDRVFFSIRSKMRYYSQAIKSLSSLRRAS